jgi:predicted RNase H-like HicB family nuclease
MSRSYIALIHPPETAGRPFGVTFPDLPGCVSAGATREEAIQRAAEALGGHLALMRADGEALPAARDFMELQADPDIVSEFQGGAEPCRIPVLALPAPKERVNIMIARDVLKHIDAAAAQRGISRSAFIEAAAGQAARKRSA